MSYFVLMVRYHRVNQCEAIVDLTDTWDEIVREAADAHHSEDRSIEFVHSVSEGRAFDITEEVKSKIGEREYQ